MCEGLGAERKGAVGAGKLLAVQPHLAKDTNVWTTLGWAPEGASGTGLCRAATGYCSSKTGFIKKETGRWNHRQVVAGEHSRSVKGSILAKDELQNRVPAELLTEVLATLRG